LKGNAKAFDPNKPLDEQVEFLSYKKRWEIPKNRLRLGELLKIQNLILADFIFIIVSFYFEYKKEMNWVREPLVEW
jgi:hypothetical protein